MRWTRWVVLVSFVVSLSGVLLVIACARAPQTNAPTAEDKIERGRYLVTVTGCGDCHTPGTLYGVPDTTRRLSGSELGWHGPWGVSYPRNLTPDPETGIGSWTEEQIVKAIRMGQRPDGSPLLPPMPWPDFAFLTDEDAAAIAAYLKSIPAVSHKVPAVIPPSQKPTGAYLSFPPPPEWDARNLPPPPAAAGTDTAAKH